MELRHLRYFVAVAEEGSLTRAAGRLRVAQPGLSRQLGQLEAEVGVSLLERSPRGVKLTSAGEAFLIEARKALEHAALAADTARGASQAEASALRFANGQLFAYGSIAEELLAAFRAAWPQMRVAVMSQDDSATYDALIDRRVDVGCVFTSEWPVPRFGGHRLAESALTGVLLPARHPLAGAPVLRLADLRGLPWIGLGPQRWPGFYAVLEEALWARGLRPKLAPSEPMLSPFVHIAAGAGWALANETAGAPYLGKSSAIVYRPFVEPAIPIWLALVWVPPATPGVERLVETARKLGFDGAVGTPSEATSKPA